MKKEGFKVGCRYRVKSNEGVFTCVGISLEGSPIMQIEDQKPFRAEYPDLWVEHREPREFFMVVWPDGGICVYREDHQARAFAAGNEIFRVREVIE